MSAVPAGIANRSTAVVRCAHCAQPVPAGLIDESTERQFCCAGCEAVYRSITGCGLTDYYRLRDAAAEAFAPAAPTRSKFDAFDSPAFEKLYVPPAQGPLKSVELALENVTCAACVWLVERLPGVIHGVAAARLSLRDATVTVTWDPSRVALSQIARTLDRFGYTPHPARGIAKKELHRREERKRLIHLALAGALMGNTMLVALALYAGDRGGMDPTTRQFFRWLSLLLGGIALVWPGATFFRSAFTAIRLKRVNLDVPIALALLAGGVAGVVNVLVGRGDVYFDSLTVLVFLLLVGRFLQFRQQRKADDAVELLFSMTPATCRVVRGDDVQEVPIETLQVGQIVEIRPGDLVPADGTVVDGRSGLNHALLTGESMPVEVGTGDRAFGGALNAGSVLRVRVEAIGEHTRVGKLMKLVERGVAEKPPIVQFADRVGAWFTVVVTLVATATFAFWAWRGPSVITAIDHTVALLIVTCPCVLGLATPLTIAVAIGRLARRGILVKSGVALEKLSHSQGGTILLDKTGTITEGRMALVRWIGDERLQPLVAELERKSAHPVARALVEALPRRDDVEVTEIEDRGSGGVRGRFASADQRGQIVVGSPAFLSACAIALRADLASAVRDAESAGLTAVVAAIDGVSRAVAVLGDRPRSDSTGAIASLRQLRWQPRIVSGDAAGVVSAVAGTVGVDPTDAWAGVMPEQKLTLVHESPRRRPTVMVGDGVNDAAALAAADVGIAVHGGAEASLAAADVYVATPGLAPIVDLAATARKTMRVIRRNLLVSLAYNLLAGVLAVCGVMTPLIAAIIMPISSASVLSLAAASMSRPTTPVDGGKP